MTTPRIRRWDWQAVLVAGFAGCVSLVSFLYYFHRGDVLLYGDAVAHINIARRVFDSHTPGLLQLGTVWLPLPHLLMVPFLLSHWMWQTGVGGSIPSMVAYVFGAVGIFRLVRHVLQSESTNQAALAGWAAAIIYAANPNLIYLQSTAMTEPVYLALFIWALVHFVKLVGNTPGVLSSSIKCGVCLFGACLTRYDGWLLAAGVCGVVTFASGKPGSLRCSRRDLRNLVMLAAAGPVFWFLYNAAIYRNPVEFATGPYSAKAIEQKTSIPGAPPHPGAENPAVAMLYFLKSTELNMASLQWLQRFWLIIASIASLVWISRFCRQDAATSLWPWPLLLLWIPLPFYALSIAYGGVPLFVPAWWPFSHYNLRYGLQLLPAIAVFSVLAVHFIAIKISSRKYQIGVKLVALVVLILSYGSTLRDAVCFREAWINSRTRIELEKELAAYLVALPRHSQLLMYLGDHVGALQQAGIPLRRVIHEGNHRVWKQPYDPNGLWERALASPETYVDYVVAFEGDPVSAGIDKANLVPIKSIKVTGQRLAVIYTRRAAISGAAKRSHHSFHSS